MSVNFSNLIGAPLGRVFDVISADSEVVAALSEEGSEALAFLVERTVQAVREDDAATLAHASLTAFDLSESVPAGTGRALVKQLSDVFEVAATRTDSSAHDMIARGFSGKAGEALKQLAAAASSAGDGQRPKGTIWQGDLAARLSMSTSNMSHLMADLAAADLITRTQHGQKKAVALTTIGRRYVEQTYGITVQPGAQPSPTARHQPRRSGRMRRRMGDGPAIAKAFSSPLTAAQ